MSGWIDIPQRGGIFKISGSWFCRNVEFTVLRGAVLEIRDAFIGRGTLISCHDSIRIGRGTLIAENVAIHDNNHNFSAPDLPISSQGFSAKPIVIGNDVWIGSHCVILSGVTIGDHAVIGAGSIVTADIPAWAVAVGNPAKIKKYRKDL